ncbi:hypothetical protein CTA2_5388 [Colletotrichum tanaceti]|uniref:N-acetyltransferase domain-containing protein n=1 Tax=Colletotrichum tanaceti TaxID=1306861 RepID=A0A4U6XHK2_9PEZI|nr:hypothetical protein CTA2_5388 [Colletotrichum tanaceti]TKW54782.1 hypothetical protein CTA1_5888 [Colletotrichum tanaceti]
MSKVRVRDGGVVPHDAPFIVEAFDSTVPHLAAIGSGEMWGSPFSEKEGFAEETADDVRKSDKYRTTGEGEALRIFVAEVNVEPGAAAPFPDSAAERPGLRYRTADDGTRMLSVGAAFVRDNWLPGHVESQFHVDAIRAELEGNAGFAYMDVLVSDFRTGHHRKGAGEALLRRAVDYGLEKGMKALYVDAWAGNERKLVGWYERQGFTAVADFGMKRGNGTTWPGALMRMSLGS